MSKFDQFHWTFCLSSFLQVLIAFQDQEVIKDISHFIKLIHFLQVPWLLSLTWKFFEITLKCMLHNFSEFHITFRRLYDRWSSNATDYESDHER